MLGETSDWPIVGGALVSTPNSRRSNNLVSRLHFRDALIHVEFELPKTGDGNNGVYRHGLYEIQILRSPTPPSRSKSDMGAVYGLHPPRTAAGLGPGKWQSLEICFRAPQTDSAGTLQSSGTITAWLNGRLIQDRAKIAEKASDYTPRGAK